MNSLNLRKKMTNITCIDNFKKTQLHIINKKKGEGSE